MRFDDFKEEIQHRIKDYLPEQYKEAECSCEAILKNNGIHLTGLMVKLPTDRATAMIYLEDYYAAYESGKEIEGILADLAKIVPIHRPDLDNVIEDLFDVNIIRDKIVYRLINRETNEELLSEVPHRNIADLAVVYDILLKTEEERTATIQIRNEMMDRLGLTEKELHRLAEVNTPALRPLMFRSIEEMLPTVQSPKLHPDRLPMYVVTSRQMINSAAVLLYPEFDDVAIKRLGEYYILPSSTHEVIVVPKEGMEGRYLKQMVQEINRTMVTPEEYLSDNIYEIADKRIKIVETLEKVA